MAIDLPAHVAGSGALDQLVNTARDYASAATSDNMLKACCRQGIGLPSSSSWRMATFA